MGVYIEEPQPENLTEKEAEKWKKDQDKKREAREKLFKQNGCRTLGEFKRLQASLLALETGIFGLDMGIGYLGPDGLMGLRQRDVIELIGKNGSGKTACLDQMILDTLNRFGPGSVFGIFSEPPEIERMERKGINLDWVTARFCFEPELDYKKNSAEDHLETALDVVEYPDSKVKLVFVDSVAALCPNRALYDAKSKDFRGLEVSPPAALAITVNNFLLQWSTRNKSNASLVFVNHYKTPINIEWGEADEINTPGGRGMEFFEWVRVLVKGRLKLRDKDSAHSVEGTRSSDRLAGSFTIFKNKYSHSDNHRVIKWELDLSTGRYNNEEKLIEWASMFGARVDDPNKKGQKITVSELDPPVATTTSWVYIGEEKFQGLDNAVEYLQNNPEIYQKLKLQMYPRSRQFFLDEKPNFETELDGGA